MKKKGSVKKNKKETKGAEAMIQDFLGKTQEIAVQEGIKKGLYKNFKLRFTGTDEELEKLSKKLKTKGLTMKDLDKFELSYETALKGCAGSYGQQQ